MRCPACHAGLLQKSEGKLKLRVPILVFSPDGASCVTSCPRCHREIALPVTLQKAGIPADEPRLVVSRVLTRG